MLAYREHTAVFHSAREGDAMTGNNLGIGTIDSATHQGVFTVDNIEHWGEVHMNPQSATFACHLAAIVIKQFVVANATQIQIARELGSILQTHRRSPLGIKRDKQRHSAQRLGIIGEFGLRSDVTLMINETAHLILRHQFLHQPFGTTHAWPYSHHKQLRDAFVRTHGVESVVHPTLHGLLVHFVKQFRFNTLGHHRQYGNHEHKNSSF